MPLIIDNRDGTISIAVKAVPGASRDQIAGALAVKRRDAEVVRGQASAE